MNAIGFSAACLATAAALCTGALGAQEPGRDAQLATYASGGVSEESRAALEERAAQFNIRVIFALTSGAYLAGVAVTVVDSSGKVVFSTVAEGPLLYARLAPGNYEMQATLAGQAQAQKFSVPARGSRQLVFRWEREG